MEHLTDKRHLAPDEPSMREKLGIKDEDEQQKTREKTT